MKKIVFSAIVALSVCGCFKKKDQSVEPSGPIGPVVVVETNKFMQVKFNEETYIWESLIFTTNRVEK